MRHDIAQLIAVRAHDYPADPDGGGDVDANRAVLFLELRWGRVVRWEDNEDTERVAAWDRARTEREQPT